MVLSLLKEGEPIFTPSFVPYGYRLNSLEPEIIPEEAEVVRQIFAAALQGQGHTDITKWLNKSGVKRGDGRDQWHCCMVRYILSNRFYTGDSDWHKTWATDTLPIQQVKTGVKNQSIMWRMIAPVLSAGKTFSVCRT